MRWCAASMPKRKKQKTDDPKSREDDHAASCKGFLSTSQNTLINRLVTSGALQRQNTLKHVFDEKSDDATMRTRVSAMVQNALFDAVAGQTSHGQGTVEFSSYFQYLALTACREKGQQSALPKTERMFRCSRG